MRTRRDPNQENTQGPLPDAAIRNIYGMIDRQETSIMTLLDKYRADESLLLRNSQSRTPAIDIVSLPPSSLRGSRRPTRQIEATIETISEGNHPTARESVSLPLVHYRSRLAKSRKKKHRKLTHSTVKAPRLSAHVPELRGKLGEQLYRIYGSEIPPKGRYGVPRIESKSKEKVKKRHRVRAPKKLTPITPMGEEPSQHTAENEEGEVEQLKQTEQMNEIESEDSSSREEIGMEYYEKQFRTLLGGQCREELNFLFFSHNEATKDWTENLLALIERHDKEVASLRRRSRYLETFDDVFFSMGVLQNM